MRRWLFNLAAGVSLLLALLSAVLSWMGGRLDWRHDLSFEIRTRDGLPTDDGWHIWSEEGVLHILPFYSIYEWKLPYWRLMLLFSVPPARWMQLRLRRRKKDRLRKGLCPNCGYDLRATPDRCPECGAVSAAGGKA